MADNYLITGYRGEPHVTAENDRGIHAGIFGDTDSILNVGECFRAEYIGNNTIRMYDGKLVMGGAVAGIPAGEYVDLLIENASQGKVRKDFIVFQYQKDPSTLIETGSFVVLKGREANSIASDPDITRGDVLSGKATLSQMTLWRVTVSGTAIAAPERMKGPITQFSTRNPPPYPVKSVNGKTGAVKVKAGYDYSTEEIKTDLLWIDGKPVYTKMIACSSFNTATTNEVALDENLEFGWIDVSASFLFSNNNAKVVPLMMASSDIGLWVEPSIAISAKKLKYFVRSTLGGDTIIYFKIFYTKTTDTATT